MKLIMAKLENRIQKRKEFNSARKILKKQAADAKAKIAAEAKKRMSF